MNRYLVKLLSTLGVTKKYVSKCKIGRNKWAYVSYIPYVYYHKNDKSFMSAHQNRREQLVITDVLNSLGYNVFVGDYKGGIKPKNKFNLIFGVEPGFTDICELNPQALKVYYATGAYAGHQNSSTRQRTEIFNKVHNSSYPIEREVSENPIYLDIADYILQIGSQYTIETYPEKYRKKITTIHQSSTLDEYFVDISNKEYNNNKHIMWLGSGGLVLKGLDLVIDAVKEHPDIILHVIGRMNDTFLEASGANKLENIYFHGFQNLGTDEFLSIANQCCFMVYPSSSEGGIPGSVINTMRFGLIPIVTKYSADDNIEKAGGIIIDNFTPEAVYEKIHFALNLRPEEIKRRSESCKQYAEETYNIKRFKQELYEYFRNLK